MIENKNLTQKEIVLKYLKANRFISPGYAWENFGISRLADIIFKLRSDGHDIETRIIKAINRYDRPIEYARYIYTAPVFDMTKAGTDNE